MNLKQVAPHVVPLLAGSRVGNIRATEPAEFYLRSAFELFGGGKVAKEVVLLLENFYIYKRGCDGNKESSAVTAVGGVVEFMRDVQEPPWRWTSQLLYKHIANMAAADKATSTMRGRHFFINSMCISILADRSVANKLEAKYPGCSFQQITNNKSRSLIRSYRKRTTKLIVPSPQEMNQLHTYLEASIRDEIQITNELPVILLRDRAILTMLQSTGLRLSELVNVNITDFSFNPECPLYGEIGLLHVIGKGDKPRTIPITSGLFYEVLSSYLEHVRPHWVANPKTPNADKKALFFSNFGKRISGERVQALLNARFHEAGVEKKFSPHRLRNSCITQLVDNIGLAAASKIAGHSFAATTEGYYSSRASMVGDSLTIYTKKIYKGQFNDKDVDND